MIVYCYIYIYIYIYFDIVGIISYNNVFCGGFSLIIINSIS
jgi:hypothetical protein